MCANEILGRFNNVFCSCARFFCCCRSCDRRAPQCVFVVMANRVKPNNVSLLLLFLCAIMLLRQLVLSMTFLLSVASLCAAHSIGICISSARRSWAGAQLEQGIVIDQLFGADKNPINSVVVKRSIGPAVNGDAGLAHALIAIIAAASDANHRRSRVSQWKITSRR